VDLAGDLVVVERTELLVKKIDGDGEEEESEQGADKAAEAFGHGRTPG
jgi:hypothetical protein